MASISISTAWEETSKRVRRDVGLLVPVALALIVLPGVVLDQLRPAPDTAAAAATALHPSMLVNPLSLLITLFASLAITLLALRPGISVGEALRSGLGRLGVAVGSSLLLGVAFALLVLPVLPILTGGEAALEKMNPAVTLLLLAYMVAVLVALIYVLVRMLLLNTVAAAEHIGVFATISRTWDLSRGLFGRLLGFLLIFLAASVVASVAVVAAGGTILIGLGRLLGDEALGQLLLQLLTNTVNAGFVTWLYLMLADIYRQLAATSPATGSKSGI